MHPREQLKPEQTTHGADLNLHNKKPNIVLAQPDQILRLPAVCTLTGLGKSSVYSLEDFPKRVVLSRRAVGWKLSELTQWMASRSEAV